MRLIPVAIAAILTGCLALPATFPNDSGATSALTVVLDLKGKWSRNTIREMQQEAARILEPSGLRLNWDVAGKHPQGAYIHVAVLVLRGRCEFDAWPRQVPPQTPYAFTWITDDYVMPFGQVNCDRVVSAVQEAASGRGDYTGADFLLGRALGRVVAHELVHMTTQSVQHSTEGVRRPALTDRQLVQPDLPLTAEDLSNLRKMIFGPSE